uniref:Putative lipocalin-like tilipo37 n=1 Tax=Panstrongylus lignarius TaxID=156445 RepID=A0A224XL38_9HEMI
MKTFIVLTFIGILNLAYAAQNSECNTGWSTMVGFSASRFFEYKWYVTHIEKESNKTFCQTFDTSSSGSEYDIEFELDENGAKYPVSCDGRRERNNQLSFNCKKNGQNAFQAEITVSDTDYNDYAAIFTCITTADSKKYGNHLIVRREAGKEDIPVQIQFFTNRLNLGKCSDVTKTSKNIVDECIQKCHLLNKPTF